MNGPKPIRKGTFILAVVLLVSVYGFSQSYSKTDHAIRGKLHLDSIWEPVVYLSYIPSFTQMNTMSYDMIIAEARVDSSGLFSFPTNYLPEEDKVYRLHISKTGAPAASLILGGREENHMFLTTNGNTSIYIEGKETGPVFKDATIDGYAPNLGFRRIDRTYSYIDSTHYGGTAMKKEFVVRAIYEELRYAADTSVHALVSLYALYRSNFESNHATNPKFYEDYLAKWESESSQYFTDFRASLPMAKPGTSWTQYALIGIGFFLLGFALHYLLFTRKKKARALLTSLSVQERKIFTLIQSGKSNKEISEEYNIGLSTVKSHVSNIYSKLNIKSRREAMDL